MNMVKNGFIFLYTSNLIPVWTHCCHQIEGFKELQLCLLHVIYKEELTPALTRVFWTPRPILQTLFDKEVTKCRSHKTVFGKIKPAVGT